jgi:putative ubiquitin-RnfH superfamily antitoxin RatB of RatAB toxin-antitoxin module
MPEVPDKRCLVAVDVAGEPLLLQLKLPATANVAAALEAARQQLPEAAVDWEGAATGIWGIRCDRAAVPREGDRIELYRALPADPRQRRRQRAQLKRPAR